MKKIIIGLVGVLISLFLSSGHAFAADCRDIEFIFARGSGAARKESDE